MARGKHGWIGIDFGSKVAKIAQLERAGDRLRWRRALVPHLLDEEGRAYPGEALLHALQVDGGFRGRTVACTLPMSATELRTVSVPPGSAAERRAMIAQELEAAAASEEPREFDFWQSGANANEQDGLQVVSVSSAKVAQITTSLAAAGLECAVLDGLPCALARAVGMAATGVAEGPTAAIDWGYANATLTIVERGRAQFTRPLRDCGAGALFAEVSQTLGLDEADAIELLTRFGLPGTVSSGSGECGTEADEIREVVVDIVGSHVQRMVDELTRTFAFFRLQRQALLPQRAWLFGAGATVKNAASFLSTRLDLPCDVWRLAADEPQTTAAGVEIFGPAAALSALAFKS